MKYIIFYFTICILFFSSIVSANDEFDLSFINGRDGIKENIATQLSSKYPPGEYITDVLLNNQQVSKSILKITNEDKDNLCLSSSWLKKSNVFINETFFKNDYDSIRKCYLIDNNNDSSIEFDFSSQKLYFKIPQAGIIKKKKKRPKWNFGTSAVRANYNINGNFDRYGYNYYAQSSVIFNLADWVIDSSAYITPSDYNVELLSASHAFENIHSDLSLGNIYGGNELVGGSSMYGLSLSSNENMYDNRSSYKPVFTGIAKTYSRVTLSQNGIILYSEMMPSGPFKIDNVPITSSGDVILTITGNNGNIDRFTYPYSVSPNMISPGDFKYKSTIGFQNNGESKDIFGSILFGYGFSGFSINSAAIVSPYYLGFGNSIETGIFGGVLSFSFLYGDASYTNTEKKGGQISTNYNVNLFDDFDFRLSNTKFLSENFVSFSDFNHSDNITDNQSSLDEEYTVGLYGNLTHGINFNLSGWDRKYYRNNEKQKGFTFGLSAQYKKIALSSAISFSQTKYDHSYDLSLNLSIPFDLYGRSVSSISTINTNNLGITQYSSNLSSSLTDNIAISVGSNWSGSGEDMTNSFDASYSGDKINSSVNVSKSDDYSGALSISGGGVYLPKINDFVLAKSLSDTIAIAHVEDLSGVKFIQSNESTDSSGLAVLALNSYQYNSITLDTGTLPLENELLSSTLKVFPTDRSVSYIPFNTIKVNRYLLRIKDKKGGDIQNGSWAEDKDGKPLGFITNNGVLYFSSIDKPKQIIIGNCKINEEDFKNIEGIQNVNCK